MTARRRWWWRATLLAGALATALPGGAAAQSEPTVGSYVLVGSTRVTRTVFDFTYRARLTNPLAHRLTGVRATLTSLAPATTVVDGTLDFGDVEAGATVTSLDTFTIRQDRTVPFDPAALVWSISYGRAPTANAGPDQTVAVGTEVQLDGSASTDPDGDTLTFRWRLSSVPAGSGATLSDPTALRPTFRVDRGGTYVVELVVRDGALESAPDTVQISTLNSRPVASAGPDQTVPVGATVVLDGQASADVDLDPLSFRWAFVLRPDGSAATLDDPSAVGPSFITDLPGRYVVRLIVDDGVIDSVPDTVQIDTLNSAPVADAGPDLAGTVGTPVVLDGRGSADADGDPLTFRWSFTTRPGASAAAFDDPALARPTFVPDLPGDYVAQLIVNDGALDSVPDTALIAVTSANRPPVANAGPDQTVARGVTVRLDGSGSTDPDGTPLTFAWTLLSRPNTSAASLLAATTATPTFVADVNGTYVAQLIVSDGALASAPDTVTIAVQDGADLRIFFETPPAATPAVGGTISFGLRIDNLGPAAVTGVTAHVPVPAGYTFVSSSLGSYDSGTGVWSIPSISASSFARLSVGLRVLPAGPYDLTATITTSSRPDPDLANNTASAIVTPNPNADLHIFFETPPATTPAVGGTISAGLRISNLGPSATTNVIAHVPIPAGYAFVSSALGTYDSATGLWSIPSISGSGFARLSLGLRVLPAGPYDLTATITASSQPDPDPANDTAVAVITPNVNADLHIFVETPPPANATVGGNVGLMFRIDNLGPSATTGVSAHIPIPAGYTLVSAALGTYDSVTGIWTIPSLSGSGFGRLALSLRVNATGSLELTGTITGSSQPDPDLANNTVTAPRVNRPPVANAGTDQSVATDTTVTLNGSQSTDPDGDAVTFAWVITQRAANSTATLSGADTASPSFVADRPGTYRVQLTVRDPSGVLSAADSVAVTASVLNQPPVILSTPVTLGAAGQPYQYAVHATDPDAGDTLTFSLPTAPAGMTIGPSTGLIQWTPGDGQGGPQNVSVRAQDAAGLFATQTFAVQVSSAANQAPVASDDAYEVRVGESLSIATPGVLANDRDADGAPLTAQLLQGPANGTLLFNPDGSFTYTPQTLTEGDVITLSNVNLATRVPGVTATASSAIDPGPGAAIDDAFGSAWSTGFDASPPFFEIHFPQDITVSRLELYGSRTFPDRRIGAGIFQLFNAAGAELFTSGNIDIPPPSHDVTVHMPSVAGVRRVRFHATATPEGTSFGTFDASIEELKVFGTAVIPRPAAVAEPNLSRLLPTHVDASSFISPNVPEAVIDDSAGTNWFASSFNAGEFLELVFPLDVTVTEIRAEPARGRPDGFGTSLLINQCMGRFTLFDAAGAQLFDSGVANVPFQVAHPHGGGIFETFVLTVPSVANVRRVRYTTAGCIGGSFPPGFEELQVFGTASVTRPAFRLARKFNALAGREIHSTPLVVNLTDDNADGRIDRNDIPDIVVLMESLGNQLTGEVKVLSGDDGRELATLGGPNLVSPWSDAAVGDIDGDGIPDVVALHSDGNHLIAFDLSAGPTQGDLTQLLRPLAFNVSSSFPGLPPERVVDGNPGTSWFTASGDAVNRGTSPFFELIFPQDATVTELRMLGNRQAASGFDFLAGVFQLRAADGRVLFDSGVVNLPAPDRDIVLPVPGVTGVRRVRFTPTADEGADPGFAELTVIGSAVLSDSTAHIKWLSDSNPMPRFALGNSTLITGTVAIANLDASGPPEIVVGASVFDSTGRLLGDGRALGGTTGGTGLRSAISAVADLDLDGIPELVAGPTAYRLASGVLSIVWRRPDRPDGYVAIGNFDDDPEPEIVIVANGVVYMLNHDGSDAEVWNPPTHAPVPIPGGGQGGAPTIADVDGDGIPEIGVAGAVYYTVFNRDGSVRWKSAIRDRSSNATGSTVFDFDGDGSVEVIYRDELFLRVYRGSDGVLLARTPISSSTWAEQPIVADVDNDGHADLVVVGDPFIGPTSQTGVHVLQDMANQWKRTRRIWNQHSYHVTNVDEDGRIPVVETPHWLAPGLNNFRLNAFAPGESADQADRFTYRVTDGTLLSDIATVRLAIRPQNSAPRFVSTAITTAAPGVRYTYAARATDPDAGDILTFSLPTAPTGMTIDPISGLIQWIPTPGQLGNQSVVVRVQDLRGLFALQGYAVQVATAVTVPDVVGQPEATAATTITGANLLVGSVGTRNTTTTPTGAVFSQDPAAGALAAPGSRVDLVVSLGPPPVGTVPDVVGLSQPGAQADITAAGFLLGAVGGQHSTVVPLGVVLGQNPAAGTAAPGGSVVTLVVSLGTPPGDIDADGDGVTGNQGDCDDTNPDIRPGAVDIAGDGIDQNCNGPDSIAGDDTPPTVAIDAPAETAVVTLSTDVVGTATDTNFLRYTLAIAPVNTPHFTTLRSGSSPVVAGVLGRLDPTLLENGLYRLRLTAEDVNGHVAVAEQVVQVNGAKVGHARLSFLDLEVPVAGIPIRVVRTYDSRVKTPRDFGVGWSLDVRQGAYQHNRAPGLGWQIVESSGPLGLPCQTARETLFHVTQIWLSDREVYTFKPRLVNLAAVVGGCVADVRFEFVDGSTPGARLDILGNAQVLYTSGNEVRDFGGGEDTGVVYDPPRVRLTTRDRRVIDLDRGAGIVRIQDANANALTIGEGGIVHSSGKSIAFQRDPHGRITRITDPAGDSLHYAYDASGNLATLTTRTANVVTHTYDSSHRLETIVDGLGHVLFRAEYDEEGRLRATQDADGGRITLAHDLAGSRSTLVNRAGDTTVYHYDERGNIVRVVDGRGHPTALAYGPFDTLLSTVDALGHTSIATYDDQGNVLTRRDPLGHVTSYTYDASGRVLTATDALGRTTTHTYDARGNRLSTTGPDGHTWGYAYDDRGNLVRHTDPAGQHSTFGYDVFGRLTSETTPCGGDTRYEYDAAGRLLRTLVARLLPSGAREQITTSYAYDGEGRPIRTTYHDGLWVSREFDAAGHLRATIDRLGRRTTYSYTPAGRLVAVTHPDGGRQTYTYDAEGRLASSTDPSGRTTAHVYDALGQEIRTIGPDGSTTTMSYDALGQLVTVTDALGRTTAYAHDAAGRQTSVTDPLGRITRHAYDAVGNVTSSTDANGHVTAYEYDADNRRTRVVHPDGTRTQFTYDFASRVTATTDQAGLTTRYDYDACGRLASVIDALGGTASHVYDSLGRRVSQRDAAGRVTSWEYDALHRVTRRTLPLGMSETFAYDAVGNLVARTDFSGRTIDYGYDTGNRLITKRFPDGASASFSYNPAGQRVTATDARGVTEYRYDAAGQLATVIQPDGAQITYAYDPVGNRTAVTVPSGTTTFGYDAVDRLSTLTEPDGALTRYQYDAADNLVGVQYPNGSRTERAYDSLDRLVRIEHRAADDHVLSSFAYTLGPIGNRLQVVEDDGRTVAYTYDALYRLVGERITGAGLAERTVTYTYDLAGNRLTRQDSAGGLTTYAYDANDRLLSENGASFTYDADGNLLTRPGGAQYRYDAEHRLIAAETPAGLVTYVYDADGVRVRANTADTVTTYLVDVNRPYAEVLEERDGAGALRAANVFGHDLVRRQDAGSRHYYHHDAQRSVRHLTDASGSVADRYTYDAFGRLLDRTGTSSNPYLFGGEHFDARLGEYYLRARYYDPALGRFTAMDPVAAVPTEPRSLHRYAYGFNDPVNRRDPSGEFGLAEAMISVSISGILAQLALPGATGADIPVLHIDATQMAGYQDPTPRYQNIAGAIDAAIPIARAAFAPYNVRVLAWRGAAGMTAVAEAGGATPKAVEAKLKTKTVEVIPHAWGVAQSCDDRDAWGCAPKNGPRGWAFLQDIIADVAPSSLPRPWRNDPSGALGSLLGFTIAHEAGHLYGTDDLKASVGFMGAATVRERLTERYWDAKAKKRLEEVLGLKP